jgi:hypothetical protein
MITSKNYVFFLFIFIRDFYARPNVKTYVVPQPTNQRRISNDRTSMCLCEEVSSPTTYLLTKDTLATTVRLCVSVKTYVVPQPTNQRHITNDRRLQ